MFWLEIDRVMFEITYRFKHISQIYLLDEYYVTMLIHCNIFVTP